jgi:hypothetical protein
MKNKLPFCVGWKVRRSGGLDTGTVQQIREHDPVMIRVYWDSRTSNKSEWVPVGELVLAFLPPKASEIAIRQESIKQKAKIKIK